MVPLIEHGLATFKVTRALVHEVVGEPIRRRTSITPVHCTRCAAPYVALVVAFMPSVVRRALAVAAISDFLQAAFVALTRRGR